MTSLTPYLIVWVATAVAFVGSLAWRIIGCVPGITAARWSTVEVLVIVCDLIMAAVALIYVIEAGGRAGSVATLARVFLCHSGLFMVVGAVVLLAGGRTEGRAR